MTRAGKTPPKPGPPRSDSAAPQKGSYPPEQRGREPAGAQNPKSREEGPLPGDAEGPTGHLVHEIGAKYGSVESISPEERALVTELVEDGLAIQDRFQPEPRYRQTGKGHFESRTVEDLEAAGKKQARAP